MTPGLLAMYACSFGTAFVLSGSEVGVIAVLRGLGQVEFIAWVFAVWGIASGAGGLVYGAMRRGASSPLVLLAWLSLATLPLALATTPLLLLLLVVPAGVLVAPVLSASADGVSRRTLRPQPRRGDGLARHRHDGRLRARRPGRRGDGGRGRAVDDVRARRRRVRACCPWSGSGWSAGTASARPRAAPPGTGGGPGGAGPQRTGPVSFSPGP